MVPLDQEIRASWHQACRSICTFNRGLHQLTFDLEGYTLSWKFMQVVKASAKRERGLNSIAVSMLYRSSEGECVNRRPEGSTAVTQLLLDAQP